MMVIEWEVFHRDKHYKNITRTKTKYALYLIINCALEVFDRKQYALDVITKQPL